SDPPYDTQHHDGPDRAVESIAHTSELGRERPVEGPSEEMPRSYVEEVHHQEIREGHHAQDQDAAHDWIMVEDLHEGVSIRRHVERPLPRHVEEIGRTGYEV